VIWSTYTGQYRKIINSYQTRRCNMKVLKAIHSYQEYHRVNSKKKYAKKL
jgi:ribosomal protein L14E/L6E/L27E